MVAAAREPEVPERGGREWCALGAASSISETAYALGIAVLGSIHMAAYRAHFDARSAITTAMQTTASIAAILMAAAAVAGLESDPFAA